jgi:hypothetical protein
VYEVKKIKREIKWEIINRNREREKKERNYK